MKISKLIAGLINIKEQYGDIECYTNGEHGYEDTIVLGEEQVCVGKAHMEINHEKVCVDKDEIVCHIGGY